MSDPTQPKLINAMTLESLSRIQSTRLCHNMYKLFNEFKTARQTRQNEWTVLDSILGGKADNGQEKSWYGSDKSLLNAQEWVDSQLATPGGQNPNKLKQDKRKVDRVQEMLNTQASLAKASYDTYITNLMSATFPLGQENLYVETFDSLEPQRAMSLQSLMRTHNELIGLRQQVKQVYKEAAKYGTAVAKYEWATETRKLLKKAPDSKGYFKEERVVYNAAKLTTIPIQEVFFDTASKNIEGAFVIQKKLMTVDEIVDNPNYPMVKDDIDRTQKYAQEVLPAMLRRIQDTESLNLNMLYNAVPDGNNKIEVYECWGDFTLKSPMQGVPDKVYRNYVFEFTRFEMKKQPGRNGPVMQALRFEPNPYGIRKPYIIVRPYEDCASQYAKSPYEVALPHFQKWAGLNTAAKDLISQAACRPLTVNATLLQPESKTKLEKEAMTSDTALFFDLPQGASITGVMARMQDDQGQSASAAIELCNLTRQEIRELIGETESQGGGSPPQYMKTGVALAYQQGAQNRLAETARMMEDQLLVPLARLTLDYFEMFLSQGGEILTERGSLKLDGPVDFTNFSGQVVFKGATYAAVNQLNTNNLMTVFQTLTNPAMAATLGDGVIMRTFKEILVRLGIASADDIVPQQAIDEKVPPKLGLLQKLRGAFYKNYPIAMPPPDVQGQHTEQLTPQQ